MFKKLFVTYFRSKFFAKILIVNTVIMLAIIAILVIFISQNVTHQISEKELRFNTQILESVNKYYEHKLSVISQMVEQIYYDPDSYSFIFDLMDKSDKESISYLLDSKKMDNYLYTSFARDNDITHIVIYSKTNDESFLYSSNIWKVKNPLYFKSMDWFTSFNDDLFGLRQIPAYQMENDKKWVYTIGANLKSKEITRNTGILLLNFDSASIQNAYQQYKDIIKGTIYILDNSGKIIFDSAGRYTGFRPALLKKAIQSGGPASSYEIDDQIVNTLPTSNGVTIVGVISKKEMFQEVNILRKNIFLLGFICVLIFIVLNLASMGIFSKKVKKIITGIQKLPKGILHQKINFEISEDEIGQIASRLNLMQDKMIEYINEVYVAEIKYKNAALVALQSQINPHFLSNTLEAIRMKAVTEGNEDVAEMIYILSFLLKTSLKNDKIVTIKEEVSYCELYLQLFSFRYHDTLKVVIEVDKEIEKYSIGKLTLQPIVENSILHGVDLQRTDNLIRITGKLVNDQINFSISDNGKGMPADSIIELKAKLENYQFEKNEESIGLLNVHERIRLLYGAPYGLNVKETLESGTEVSITIPAKRIVDDRIIGNH